ncbi:HEAT repeat domain-containing protein [Streptomyces sp. WAC01280]|uniref:HEAT repeat domain-containing protein n=1 Tax=Streptomyces sp. WAC01280 TaxID=2487424 RepID=UPI000F7B2E35|nr:HEAT repeat domain-containing protein [Streptomyces sp. WAC01280]RSS52654.1 NACHT domain-containing protein [Streptomyces sp. WAC01280]
MRGFFARRKARQTAEGATVHGPLAQITGVGGDVHVTLGTVPPPPEAPEIESARAAYATRVRQRYGGLDLEVLTPLQEQGDGTLSLQLRDVFVAQSVRADPPPVELPQELLRRLMDPAEAEPHDLPPGIDRETVDRVRRAYQERPPLPVLDVLTAPEHDRVVLLGHPGSGKSTLARYLALALTSPEPPPGLAALHGSLPLIVELREYAHPAWRERTFEDFLAHQHATEGLGLPPGTLAALLAGEGPYSALVIFDGLDELFEKDIRDAVARRIAGFAARHSRARLLVTSRGYGYRRAVLDGADFTNFMLQDLDRDQIGAFAEQWFSLAYPGDPEQARKLIERVTTAVDGSTSVRELAGNPLILTILAIIGRRRELPRDRRTVYEHAVDVLVEHWDPSKFLKDGQVEEHLPYLGPEDKRELLRLVARRMQEGHGGVSGNHIAGPDLLASFEEYLKDRYALPPDRAATAARLMLDQFRHRNFILSRFGGEIYGFVHRTFLEYLAATDLDHRFHRERSLSEEDLQDLFASKVHDPTWHEILLLLVGLLDERFVAGVIDRLLAPKAIGVPLGDHADEAFAEVAFVARCLAEVRRIGALAPQSTAMVARTIRLFEVARALGITTFPSSEYLKPLGPTLMALGADWAGRDDYLRWCEWWVRGESEEWWILESSASRLAMRIGLFLHGRGEPASTEFLAETALNGAGRVARMSAAGLLVDRAGRDPESWETVAQSLRHEPDEDVRAALMGRLRYDEDVDRDWVARLSVELLGDADTEVRQAALDCLQLHGIATPEARAALDRLSADHDPRVRESVLRPLALHAEDGAAAMELLRPALEDADPAVRAAALSAVVKRTGDERVVREFVQELLRNDGSPEVTAAAINAVREIGSDDPGTHAHLCELAGDADIIVRWAALRCLAEGGIPAGPLAELFTHRLTFDDFGWIRQYGLDLFVAHGEDDVPVRDFLLDRCRNDPSPEVQSHALMWLATLDPEAARDLAADVARNHPDTHARVSAVGHLLTECGDDERAVRLVQDLAVNDEDGAVRCAALSELRTHRSGPELVALAGDRFDHDPDPGVRHAALGILADLRRDDPDLLPLLRRAAETHNGKAIRDLANRLLAVLAPESPESPASPQPPSRSTSTQP